MSKRSELDRDTPTVDHNNTGNTNDKTTDAEFDKAKKFLKTLVSFFGTSKTKKKIRYLVALAMQTKLVTPTIKQEITRFCVEWIRSYPTESTHIAMNNSVDFCNAIKADMPNLNSVNFERIIVSDE